MQWSSYSIAWSDLKCDPKPVGRGTFGIVYHGRYRNTEVAIKRILNQDREAVVLKGSARASRSHRAWREGAARCGNGGGAPTHAAGCARAQGSRMRTHADFKAETKMLVSLRHPNIVLFMGACFDPANLAIVTEWMHKGSLHAVLHDPRITLDFSDRMRMLRDIACGMGTAAEPHPTMPPGPLTSSRVSARPRTRTTAASLCTATSLSARVQPPDLTPRLEKPQHPRGRGPAPQGV